MLKCDIKERMKERKRERDNPFSIKISILIFSGKNLFSFPLRSLTSNFNLKRFFPAKRVVTQSSGEMNQPD
jgi:hypothetical protein